MITIFNKRGRGGGSGPVNYLVGEYGTVDGKMPSKAEMELGIGKREVAPLVLRGDPQQTIDLIDGLNFSQNYTSGTLSFEESDLPSADKQQIMDQHEKTLFPGMDKDQYQVLWVEHRDKGRLELNFVIPNVELSTGKRLQPYYDKADRPRVDACQTLINEKYGLSDPHEPSRARTVQQVKNLPRDKARAVAAITEALVAMEPQNRREVVKLLEAGGFEVARETKQSISIKNPEGGRNLRLKGGIYEESFTNGRGLIEAREAAERQYREGREERILEAKERYQRGIEKRRDYLQSRYPKEQQPELGLRDIQRNSLDRRLLAGQRLERSDLDAGQLVSRPNQRTPERRSLGEMSGDRQGGRGYHHHLLQGSGVDENDRARTAAFGAVQGIKQGNGERETGYQAARERQPGTAAADQLLVRIRGAISELSATTGRAVECIKLAIGKARAVGQSRSLGRSR